MTSIVGVSAHSISTINDEEGEEVFSFV